MSKTDVRENVNGFGRRSPSLRCGLRKVRLLSDHPWMSDSDRLRKSKAGTKKGRKRKTVYDSALSHPPDLMRREHKTSALFETKLLRDGVFCRILVSNSFFPILAHPLQIQQFNRFALCGRSEGFLSSGGFHLDAARNLPSLLLLMCGCGFSHVPSQDNLNHSGRSTLGKSMSQEIRKALNSLDETMDEGR